MPYTPYTVEGFGGLNVRDDPEQVGAGGAIDALNVQLDQSGVLKPRPGYAAFSSAMSSFGTSGCAIGYTVPSGPDETIPPFFAVMSQDGTDAKAWVVKASDGTTSASVAVTGGSGWLSGAGGASFLTDRSVYFATAAGVVGLKPNVDAGSFTDAPVSTTVDGVPRYIAKTPLSRRMVQANFAALTDSPTGAGGSASTMFFSGPTDASFTWGTDDFVDVGEPIRGLVTWNELLFVFGTKTMFLFYSESTDSTGGVIFNYRPVAMNAGTIEGGTVGQASCGGPDGVYFATEQGIWRTAGGQPVLVSRPLEPVFTGDWFGTTTTDTDLISQMTCAGRYICVSYGSNSTANGRTFLYDTTTGLWTQWQIGKGSPPFTPTGSTRDDEMYYVDQGTGKVMRFDPDLATDNGSSMSWRYQSGWYDLGSPERKVIRESLLWGAGSPTYALLTDYATSDSNAAAVTLGTDPIVAEGRQRIARRGVFFSHKLSGTGAATISRLTHHLAGTYRPGADPS